MDDACHSCYYTSRNPVLFETYATLPKSTTNKVSSNMESPSLPDVDEKENTLEFKKSNHAEEEDFTIEVDTRNILEGSRRRKTVERYEPAECVMIDDYTDEDEDEEAYDDDDEDEEDDEEDEEDEDEDEGEGEDEGEDEDEDEDEDDGETSAIPGILVVI